MPRKRILTWVHGVAGRRGRWRKKYRGKAYYFVGGNGKSDADAYTAAVTEWEQVKLRVDAESPNPHQIKYELAIVEWDRVLTWSHRHGNEPMCQRATSKLANLRHGLSTRPFRPPATDDLFDSHFDAAIRFPAREKAYQGLANVLQDVWSDNADTGGYALAEAGDPRVVDTEVAASGQSLITPSPNVFDSPDSLLVEREVWRDRLEVMGRESQAAVKSARAQLVTFLGLQRARYANNRVLGSGTVTPSASGQGELVLGHLATEVSVRRSPRPIDHAADRARR